MVRRIAPISGQEWVGGRVTLPLYVTEGEPFRPEGDMWLELPSRRIVGWTLLDPKEPRPSVADTLRQAIAKPMAGPPRRPARVRVRDAVLANEVRAALGDEAEVAVAPTPELDEMVRLFVESLPEGDEPDSYFEDGRVPPEAVERLFRTAALLYRAAPWKTAHDEQLLRLDVPELGVRGACISVIGALGRSLGLLIFPSLAEFEAHMRIATSYMERGAIPDGPIDLGSSLLSLTFDRAGDLPASMRREVRAHGWPVEGPAAYPRVQHRERDGLPRPLTEVDVRIATACAGALTAFAAKHRESFRLAPFAPISESYTGETELTVRLTVPYGAWPLFEDDEDVFPPEAGSGAVPAVGRNDPCPCGSGKKYKKCHRQADAAPAVAPIHALDRRLAEQMLRYAKRRFGEEELSRATEDFDDAEESAQLFVPWFLHHFQVQGRPVADWFLDERGKYVTAAERSWLEAQARTWLGVWEVRAVEPGRSMILEDLLSGERREVREASASRLLVARDAVLGRVTDHGGEAVITGTHPRALPPLEAAEVVRRVRSRLRLKRAVPIERLRPEGLGRYLIERWEETVEELEERFSVPPMLCNTDGDELLLTTDHFAFDPALRAELEARLASLEGVSAPEEGEEAPSYAFVREENVKHPEWESTLLGTAWLSDGALRIETNSVQRADALRERVEEVAGGLIRHRTREHTDPRALYGRAVERGEPPPREPAPQEAEAFLREQKERHYAHWIDEPLPALDGQTAREAIGTARGRERVDALLKSLENYEAREPAAVRFDFGPMRRELGL